MLIFAILLLAAVQSPDQRMPDANQFHRLMQGFHSNVHDVTFVVEGEAGLINNGSMKSDGVFQSLYSIRADGATLYDMFVRSAEANKPGTRTVYAILKGKMEAVSQVPDFGVLQPTKSQAIPGVLNQPLSPERILYYWYFMTMDDPIAVNYKPLGWEVIDGHRCLKVEVDQARQRGPKRRDNMPIVRFWIDLERGGHPLKVEFSDGVESHDGADVSMRTTVQLRQFPMTTGEMIWLPAKGVTDSFRYHGRDLKVDRSTAPVFREIFEVVDGSVRINDNLADGYFAIKLNRTLPDVGGLRKFQSELAKTAPLRTDPAGVKERLDRNLAEADRQSEGLVATSTARQTWTTSLIVQVILVALGVVTVGAAVLLKWRAR